VHRFPFFPSNAALLLHLLCVLCFGVLAFLHVLVSTPGGSRGLATDDGLSPSRLPLLNYTSVTTALPFRLFYFHRAYFINSW
jgi:hypothetical protein